MIEAVKKLEGVVQRRWNAASSAMLAFLVAAATLVAAQPNSDDVWTVMALAASTGMFAGIFHAKRLKALLAGAAGGIAIGIISSFGLLQHDVEGKFAAVSLTLALFLGLGLVMGGFAEFVLFLHRLTHGRKPKSG